MFEQLALVPIYRCADCGCTGLAPRNNARLRCPSCVKKVAATRAKAWKARNPDKVVAITADRYRRKGDQMKAAINRWRANNPDKVRNIRENRRARQRAAFVEHVDRVERWRAYDGCCGICGEPVDLEAMELDHVIPLSRGGRHERSNCQPAHMVCNRRKHNKIGA